MTADSRLQILRMYSESPDRVLGTYSEEELLCEATKDSPQTIIFSGAELEQIKKRMTKLKRPFWQDDWCVPITANNAVVLGISATGEQPFKPTMMTTTNRFKSGGCVRNATINGTKSIRLLWQKEARNPRRLMLSPAGSLDFAKILVSQEKAQDSTAQGLASGRKWPASLAKYDPSTCSWRIAQHSLFGDLAEFSETWPRWGTMRNGECWALSMPGLHTSGSASGLLPTPLASLATNGGPNQRDSSGRPGLQMAAMMWPTPNCPNGGRSVKHVTDWRGKSAYHNGKKVQVGLEAAVKMWPTPTRSDGAGGPGCGGRAGGLNLRTAVATVPTPTVHGNYNRKGLSKSSGDGLATFVARFPTPCAQDAKNSTLPVSQRDRDSIPGYLLKQGEQPGGQLNPDWVEWLMGWPVRWSNLGPLDTADIASWENEPQGVPRVATGVKARTNRLKAIGNGQVPAVAALAWRILSQHHKQQGEIQS